MPWGMSFLNTCCATSKSADVHTNGGTCQSTERMIDDCEAVAVVGGIMLEENNLQPKLVQKVAFLKTNGPH